ncbi:TSUP family transporter [Alkalibaculum sp. M08DMB]|uniref:Probable membrane transporter protein n=1 Tax=Alkalibaculum sporogenes TaxID=2655001 RepID=A0A6A7K5G1_9FIRM|nr:sulfite exporter TauE/SafE family protein [Alkalibaculum sporogenes]MPW24719.1 TSUP family transporter [Alkalibaculum sporogenes]
MSDFINSIDLTLIQWILLIISAIFVGLSKTSISAFLMIVIPIIASVFGGKESTGIILPMLIVGDVFALYYYNRHADWKDVIKLLPWTAIGLGLGIFVGNFINDQTFISIIAISIMLCLIILIYCEVKGDKLIVPKGFWFHGFAGILTGFTSMIGNAAGPIFSVYLLSLGFNKNKFLGTTAWFFFIVNISKIPLQVIFWHNISLNNAMFTAILIPAIAFGAVIGSFLIKKINEKLFKYAIIMMTAIVAIKLLI